MAVENSKTGKNLAQTTGLYLGPILFLLTIMLFDFDPSNPAATRMAAIAILMAVWWISDAIPLFATALLPMILYPVLGITSGTTIAPVYFNSTIFLFIGGFMIALTMEKWSLHTRIALTIIRFIGGGPSRLVLGFMIAAAFLSMWVSNTATAIMMVPIGLAIITKMEAGFDASQTRNFSLGLMLGIAYGCSVGGMATLVGTPPNLALKQIFEISFPAAEPINFGTWFIMGLPLTTILLVIIWLLLTRVFCRVPQHLTVDRSIVEREFRTLGLMSFEEKVVLTVFSATALLWIFRSDLVFGFATIPGWSRLLPYPTMIDDGTVALSMAMLLFFIPTRSRLASTRTVMSPDVIQKLPWNIVLLFGGGFALAQGFLVSGLSSVIGEQFSSLAGLPPIVMIFITCTGLTFLTEVTSNTATTQMILPILASLAIEMRTNPLILMIPATLSASCAFMMPVATPPNAIIFGSGRVKIADMARIGLAVNVAGIIVITLVFYFLGIGIFGINSGEFPPWAENPPAVAQG